MKYRVMLGVLCSVMGPVAIVHDVRAEPVTMIQSPIRISPSFDFRATYTATQSSRTDKIMLAGTGGSGPATQSTAFKSADQDLSTLGHEATTPEFWRAMLQIGGISLIASIADKQLDTFAINHGKSGIMPGIKTVGNALPFLAIGYSATMFLSSDADSKMARASYSSLAAGGLGAVGALGLKYMVGRARPSSEQGANSFTPFSSGNGDTSWPSMHSTVMWAVITPYAKAYDAPWLYGVAAVTNAARVVGRDHWFSDTVAGSLLGYAIGDFIWGLHQDSNGGAQLMISPDRVAVNWHFD